MDLLILLGFLIVIIAIVVLGVFISKKFDLTKDDYDFALVILGLVDYISMQIDWKYRVGISQIMQLVMDALLLISVTYDREAITDAEYKRLILEEAKTQCEQYEVEVDEEFLQMLSTAIDYLL